ncbi:hypothetical protein Pelo_16657 [Pelomyxa schiedti]|nr:hypothetical protein Pelo_16657 [Pelomyxa schiedti]
MKQEGITSAKVIDGVLKFRVKWEGLSIKNSTWMTKEEVDAKVMEGDERKEAYKKARQATTRKQKPPNAKAKPKMPKRARVGSHFYNLSEDPAVPTCVPQKGCPADIHPHNTPPTIGSVTICFTKVLLFPSSPENFMKRLLSSHPPSKKPPHPIHNQGGDLQPDIGYRKLNKHIFCTPDDPLVVFLITFHR